MRSKTEKGKKSKERKEENLEISEGLERVIVDQNARNFYWCRFEFDPLSWCLVHG